MSDWISDVELDAMIQTELDSLPGWCVIEDANDVKDAAGGWKRTYTRRPSVIPFDVVPLTEQEYANLDTDKEQSVNNFLITLPAGTRIKTHARIWQVSSSTFDGEESDAIAVYEVVQPGLTDPWETGIDVMAMLIK